MKYIYISFLVYFLFGYITPYVTGEDRINLETLAPKCDCNQLINEIASRLEENRKQILNLRVRLVVIGKDLDELIEELKDSSEEINEIEIDVDTLEKQQTEEINIIKQNTENITSIEEQIQDIMNDQQETQCVLSEDTCKLSQFRRLTASYTNCACVKPREKSTSPSTPSLP